jgi:hypothetical protein
MLSLGIVDFVSEVIILLLIKVEDGKDLSVVRNESLSDRVRTGHEFLENFESDADDLWVS